MHINPSVLQCIAKFLASLGKHRKGFSAFIFLLSKKYHCTNTLTEVPSLGNVWVALGSSATLLTATLPPFHSVHLVGILWQTWVWLTTLGTSRVRSFLGGNSIVRIVIMMHTSENIELEEKLDFNEIRIICVWRILKEIKQVKAIVPPSLCKLWCFCLLEYWSITCEISVSQVIMLSMLSFIKICVDEIRKCPDWHIPMRTLAVLNQGSPQRFIVKVAALTMSPRKGKKRLWMEFQTSKIIICIGCVFLCASCTV